MGVAMRSRGVCRPNPQPLLVCTHKEIGFSFRLWIVKIIRMWHGIQDCPQDPKNNFDSREHGDPLELSLPSCLATVPSLRGVWWGWAAWVAGALHMRCKEVQAFSVASCCIQLGVNMTPR